MKTDLSKTIYKAQSGFTYKLNLREAPTDGIFSAFDFAFKNSACFALLFSVFVFFNISTAKEPGTVRKQITISFCIKIKYPNA